MKANKRRGKEEEGSISFNLPFASSVLRCVCMWGDACARVTQIIGDIKDVRREERVRVGESGVRCVQCRRRETSVCKNARLGASACLVVTPLLLSHSHHKHLFSSLTCSHSLIVVQSVRGRCH